MLLLSPTRHSLTNWATIATDGRNLIYYQILLNDHRVGIARSYFSGSTVNGLREIIEVDILMNRNFAFHNSPPIMSTFLFDYRTVFTHEAGHALGLGHANARPAVMFPYVSPGEHRRIPNAVDIAGVRALNYSR